MGEEAHLSTGKRALLRELLRGEQGRDSGDPDLNVKRFPQALGGGILNNRTPSEPSGKASSVASG